MIDLYDILVSNNSFDHLTKPKVKQFISWLRSINLNIRYYKVRENYIEVYVRLTNDVFERFDNYLIFKFNYWYIFDYSDCTIKEISDEEFKRKMKNDDLYGEWRI